MPLVNTPDHGAPRKRHAIAARSRPVQPRFAGAVRLHDGRQMRASEALRILDAQTTELREQIRQSRLEGDGAAADLGEVLEQREREAGLIRKFNGL